MSPFVEKCFFVGCWLTQGSSYISAYAYGMMHRMHHIHTDKPDDPHSPLHSSNVFKMMLDTRNTYQDYWKESIPIDDKIRKRLPEWQRFDHFAHSWITRVVWIALYTTFWAVFATQWWHWIFLPMTIGIGSLQGAVVNYFAHKIGYQSFKMDNTSRNILPFIDLFFWGEAYHNNHHKYAGRPNHAVKWFEFDPLFQVMRFMDFLGIIKLKKTYNHKNPVVY